MALAPRQQVPLDTPTASAPGRETSSSRSSTAKLLTPQYRVFPASRTLQTLAVFPPTVCSPRQRRRYRSIRSVCKRRKLPSHACVLRQYLGHQEDLIATPSIASPTSFSAAPSPYISAVSIRFMLRSRRDAAPQSRPFGVAVLRPSTSCPGRGPVRSLLTEDRSCAVLLLMRLTSQVSFGGSPPSGSLKADASVALVSRDQTSVATHAVSARPYPPSPEAAAGSFPSASTPA